MQSIKKELFLFLATYGALIGFAMAILTALALIVGYHLAS
jgi:hypothetical protein